MKRFLFSFLFILSPVFLISVTPSFAFGGGNWNQYQIHVLTPGPAIWEGNQVSEPYVIFENNTYKMWYDALGPDGICRIGYATSSDRINWTKNPNPVVDLSSQSFNSCNPSVMHKDGEYKMWFQSLDSSTGNHYMEFTNSPDGITWSTPTIVFTQTQSWEQGGFSHPDVSFINGLYEMYYSNEQGDLAIGLATSTDGINWIKYINNPVLTPSSQEGNGVAAPNIIFSNGTYTMYYHTSIGNIDTAKSIDGINWVESSNNPNLSYTDISGIVPGVSAPMVIVNPSETGMWFNNYDGSVTAIGFITTGTLNPTPTPTPTPTPIQLSSLSPAKVWVGLKNSDDVGVKFDLKAEAYKNNSLISSGELDSVIAGSSGFNNAKLNTISFNSFTPVDFPSGSQLNLELYVRNACSGSGHNSGVARLWYNDSQANSQFDATIGATDTTYYLLDNFLLGTSTGPTKKTIDIQSGTKCSSFKPFGTWVITP